MQQILIKGIGVDIASIPKIAKLVDRFERECASEAVCEILSLVFTDREQNYCQSIDRSDVAYALCFGIKEAVSKALGVGLVGIDWHEIEADLTKKPPVACLYGKAEIQAKKLGIRQWLVDWWELQDCVLVNVIGFCEEQIDE